jgi:G3E family GTPase
VTEQTKRVEPKSATLTTGTEPTGKGVPAVLVCGAAPAARMQAIRALLDTRPAHEMWAVVATPEIAAGLPDRARMEIEEVAPGCPCCLGALPFQVGLIRLLRRLKDHPAARLLIEGGTEAHAAAVRVAMSKPGLVGHVHIEDVVVARDR